MRLRRGRARSYGPAGVDPADATPAGAAPPGETGHGSAARSAAVAGDVPAHGRAASGRFGGALLVTAITVLAFNLRPTITSLPPVFPELGARLHLSPAGVTALATIPVLCFGVFSGAAAKLSRHFGDERTLFGALVVLTVTLTLRGAFPDRALFPATILASAAIAVMNVLLSGLIKRRMPAQAGLLIGIYLLSLSAGSIIGSLISVPVYEASGGSVGPVLGLWAVPAAAAVLVWLPQLRHRRHAVAPGPGVPDLAVSGRVVPGPGRRARGAGHAVYRRLVAWQVAAFMGLQSLAFFSTLSWLPTLFRDRGASAAHAGVLISVMSLGGLPTALLVPMLAHRAADQRMLVVPTVVLSAASIGGALFAPMSAAMVWMLLLGLAQGSALGLAIFFTMARAASPAIAASVSALAQSAGYLVASTGPLLVGFLHAATKSWTIPVLLLLALSMAELAAGYLAARNRVIR